MGALQRDMKMLGDITICTGLKRYIACMEGSNLAITKAFWGRISDKVCPSDDGDPVTDCDGSEDTLPLVKGYCEGKRECKLEARHTLLQKNGTHHCPGVNKYLIVNYTCIPESKSAALCDSAETTLMCEAGWVIDIADIFWGRRSHAKYCGAEEGMECDSSDSAAKYIRQLCDGKRRCPVKADQTVLDNTHSPCSGILKYLMINYVCKPAEKDDEDEEKEANKLMQETSLDGTPLPKKLLMISNDPTSKELMGLLENHLSEIKPEAQSVIGKEQKAITDSVAPKPVAPAPVAASFTPPASVRKPYSNKGKKATMARADTPSFASENEDLANVLLSGSSFENSVKKQDVPGYDSKLAKKEETIIPTKITIPRSSKKSSFSNENFLKAEITNDVAGVAKDVVPKAKEDVSYEITEPTTVRSILARAKEVLKTLDNDVNLHSSSPFLEKREGIARKTNVSDIELETEKAAATVAKLAKSLVETTNKKQVTANAVRKDIIQQSATIVSADKPKPGIKISAIVPSGPGMAGVGNTP